MARLETQLAPKSSAKFQSMLPLDTQIIQARWSGEAAWIPFGELDLDLGYDLLHFEHVGTGEHRFDGVELRGSGFSAQDLTLGGSVGIPHVYAHQKAIEL